MPNDDDLPTNVVAITALRARRHSGNGCQCPNPKLVVDVDAKEVTCERCGQRIDAFEALVRLCDHGEDLERQTKALLEQRRQLAQWKPHLLAAREVDRALRERSMVPTCPHCYEALFAEDFRRMGSTNRELAMARRKAMAERARTGQGEKDGGTHG